MTKTVPVRAVIVGIDEYKDPRFVTNKLRYAAADAHAVARAINQSTAFRVEKLELHTNETATHRRVWNSLNEVLQSNLNYDSNTITLFYFAGHGLGDRKRIYLGCHDVEKENPMQGGIPLSYIESLLLQSSAGCSIAIIDACFSGAIMHLKRIEDETAVELARRAIGALKGADDKNIAIFASCRADQVAREDDERKHGIYTDELLQGWRDGKARDEQGKVDVVGLANYLIRRFEDDEQAPRSSVLSARPVVLWYHEPPAPGTVLTPPEPLRLPRRLTDVGQRPELPVAPEVEAKPWKARLKGLAIPIVCAATGLLACGLATILVEPLRQGFLGLIFALSIVLAITSIGVHRVIGTILALIQLLLLAGFAYQYFHWGGGFVSVVAILAFLAGFIWLFWLLLSIEVLMGVVFLFSLFALMR